jgi:type II restriction enzyme
MPTVQAGLFGLHKSNRDFTHKKAWGKNQFNSSFPAALCCYLFKEQLAANYIAMSEEGLKIGELGIDQVFGISPQDPNLYFAFEAQHTPFQKYVVGRLPSIDLIIHDVSTGTCIRGLEVKLTALPDNVTCDLDDAQYGSEIVIRPDTVVYLACSIAAVLNEATKQNLIQSKIVIADWSDAAQVIPQLGRILANIENLAKTITPRQTPFLLQPIWKTLGKSPALAENCLDVFVWSDAGFCWFISQIANSDKEANVVTRPTRAAIWLYKMLLDYAVNGKFDHKKIIDELSYNTKNDKAFASSGNTTNRLMTCPNLTKPRITKDAIKNIILGNGQNLLSPERRFDAILFNSPELFTQ